jgi:CheY-like chemotaxis protein
LADTYHFLTGKRCLVLEDEFLISADLQDIFESAGAQAVCLGSAGEALALLRRDKNFDLAILDLRLGGRTEDSTTVAAVLAERGTPFIFLTGMRPEDVRSGPFPQAPVVEKPYATERLMAALREALGRS